MIRTGQHEGEVKSVGCWLCMLLNWPLILLAPWLLSRRDSPETIRENPDNYITISGLHKGSETPLEHKQLIQIFLKELCIVGLIVGGAMLLNAVVG